jgi:hypothetical protein
MAEIIPFMDDEGKIIRADAPPGGSTQAEQVRITDYRVMPWPDGTRVTVEMGLTPFKQFPALDVSILSVEGEVIRTTSLVGAVERRPSPTLHLPKLAPGTRLAVLIEMLNGEAVAQQVIVPFEVAGPIIKQAVEL